MSDPNPSTIHIYYVTPSGTQTDITNYVLFDSASFESQLAAQAGTFEITVSDKHNTLGDTFFVTGGEIRLDVDGVRLFGGFVTQISEHFAFPVVDTVTVPIATLTTRQYTLRGVDYNVWFDKRIVRNLSDPYEFITLAAATDGAVITTVVNNYLDSMPGLTTTNVDAIKSMVAQPLQQGDPWRKFMDYVANITGGIYYIDANKNLIYRNLENSWCPWGFSDVPNNDPLLDTSRWAGPTYGFRELDVSEDGTSIINDAFVWGGAGTWAGGSILFAHASNSDSISTHGRWQLAETYLGDQDFATQPPISARANVIVSGSPDVADPANGRGLVYPQWQVRLAWFSHDVPLTGGSPRHLRPGDLTVFEFFVLGPDATHPLFLELPCRSIRISFPTLAPNGKPYLRFDGFFGLQATDPWSLWRYLLHARPKSVTTVISTATGDTTNPVYGALGTFQLTPNPDGVNKVFNLPGGFGYIGNTTQVYLNGLLQRPGTACGTGVDYIETDPSSGTITFCTAPTASDAVWCICQLLGA